MDLPCVCGHTSTDAADFAIHARRCAKRPRPVTYRGFATLEFEESPFTEGAHSSTLPPQSAIPTHALKGTTR